MSAERATTRVNEGSRLSCVVAGVSDDGAVPRRLIVSAAGTL